MIKNCVVDTSYRPKAYAFIEKQVEAGRQAYVICPMVEASEMIEGENVLDYSKTLRNALPETINVEYLHGKMKAKREKQDHGTVCVWRKHPGPCIYYGY